MTSGQVVTLLLDLALILVAARVSGAVAERFGQPAVVGEILAGILAGPTFIGAAISDAVFPVAVRPTLTALGDLGIVVFMFLVGLETNLNVLRGRTVATVSLGAMVLPFGLGALLALQLRHHYSGDRPGFVIFVAIAMSVTAFPVLARIIRDRGMHDTWVGGTALASAAVCDLFAWSALAVTITVDGGRNAHWRILLVLPFVALSLLVVRPVLAWVARKRADDGPIRVTFLTMVLTGLFVWSALTEWMGIHFIFGAFIFGLIMPRGATAEMWAGICEPLEQIGAKMLLPVYFVVAGLQVNLSSIGVQGAYEFGLIIAAAAGGKFAGAFLGARPNRIGWRRAAALGALMNTRGLTELIVLTTGLELGLLHRDLFSLLVLMAVVTTVMTGPLLRFVYPRRLIELDNSASPRAVP